MAVFKANSYNSVRYIFGFVFSMLLISLPLFRHDPFFLFVSLIGIFTAITMGFMFYQSSRYRLELEIGSIKEVSSQGSKEVIIKMVTSLDCDKMVNSNKFGSTSYYFTKIGYLTDDGLVGVFTTKYFAPIADIVSWVKLNYPNAKIQPAVGEALAFFKKK